MVIGTDLRKILRDFIQFDGAMIEAPLVLKGWGFEEGLAPSQPTKLCGECPKLTGVV